MTPDTVDHADGCRRPGVVRTKVAGTLGVTVRWETSCTGCHRRSFEAVDVEVARQRAAGLEPGDHWPLEKIPSALPYLKRYFERPAPPPQRSGSRVAGF